MTAGKATTGMYASVDEMLQAHGISAPEVALEHDGFSGARITSLAQDGRRFVLKRLRLEDDWNMRALRDRQGREAQFAVSPILGRMPAAIGAPSIAAARDGAGWALLMRDVSDALLPPDGVLAESDADRVLAAAAEMHAAFWDDPLEDACVDWTPTDARLTVVGPAMGVTLVREGRDFGLARGWEVFDRIGDREAVRLAHALFEDITPFERVLASFPPTLVHGDLKFANVALDEDRVWLFDWAGVTLGPAALEIAWCAAVNSSRLPWSVDITFQHYVAHLERALGPARFDRGEWPKQRAAAMICGLLWYGWGKALDAEAGRPEELRWWCRGAVDAQRTLGL